MSIGDDGKPWEVFSVARIQNPGELTIATVPKNTPEKKITNLVRGTVTSSLLGKKKKYDKSRRIAKDSEILEFPAKNPREKIARYILKFDITIK